MNFQQVKVPYIDSNIPPLGSTLWFDCENYKDTQTWSNLNDRDKRYVEEMRSKGYVIVDNSVNPNLLDSAVNSYHSWVEKNKKGYEQNRKEDGNPPRVVDLHNDLVEVQRLFTANEAVRVQDFLFGYETSIYTSLFFETSTQQPIHRDAPVFRTSPENYYFGMWVALEDAGYENGSLIVIEGGHRIYIDQFELVREILGERQDLYEIPQLDNNLWNCYQDTVAKTCLRKGLSKKQVYMKKGQTLIWHPLLPHAGGKIRKDGATRKSIVFHTVPIGVPVYRCNVFFNYNLQKVTNRSRFQYREIEGGRHTAYFGKPKFRNR